MRGLRNLEASPCLMRWKTILENGCPMLNTGLNHHIMSNSIKIWACGLLAGLISLAASTALVHAEEDHGKKASEHLNEAIKSGKSGSAAGVISHTEQAKKELIEQNKDHPYTHIQKPIYGEHQKAEHDEEVFEEMDEAIDEAKDGHIQEAVEAVERASVHLREKEQSR
ncbi:Small metal-binding protein [Nitrosospira sp. Nl5]|nr:Small metal-binding protein [Nitrosospira sp. Nl5]